MYPFHYQIGKARLADWHAQVERDALARPSARPGICDRVLVIRLRR